MPALPSAPRRLKLLLEYSGTRYHGWQIQPNAVTVQGTLEACLARLTNGPVRLHAAGRTDAGVHALGQVVHFDTASTIALPALVRGANSLLPGDIVVRQAEDVPGGFSRPLLCPTQDLCLYCPQSLCPFGLPIPLCLACATSAGTSRHARGGPCASGSSRFFGVPGRLLHGAQPMALSLLLTDRPTRRAPRFCAQRRWFSAAHGPYDCRHTRGHWPSPDSR